MMDGPWCKGGGTEQEQSYSMPMMVMRAAAKSQKKGCAMQYVRMTIMK